MCLVACHVSILRLSNFGGDWFPEGVFSEICLIEIVWHRCLGSAFMF